MSGNKYKQAFARPASGTTISSQTGLTDLEYYAGQALEGVLGNVEAVAMFAGNNVVDEEKVRESIVTSCFDIAEDMCAEARKRLEEKPGVPADNCHDCKNHSDETNSCRLGATVVGDPECRFTPLNAVAHKYQAKV